MKKIFLSVLAIAALAACSKSEVVLDHENEIGIVPSTKNITKISGSTGALATDQELGIWAYWDNDGTVETNVTSYANYNSDYLVNALFAQKSGSWAGSGEAYPWPVNGSLVFAGYTTQGDDVFSSTAVSYNLSFDQMIFTNYNNSTEFDLCWFGRTAGSYNNRTTSAAVPVTLSHALTWISIAVYGEGTPVGNWKITKMTLSNVAVSGTGTCDGDTKKATWTNLTIYDADPNTDGNQGYVVYNGAHIISAGTTTGGKTTGTTLTNNVLIPYIPGDLTIDYEFTVQGSTKTDSKTVSLKLDDSDSKWTSGIHYTYTLKFTGNEILVAPEYGEWATEDKSVTVE